MSNKNPLLGLILLSALTQAAARQGRPDVPDLDEMLGGRQKGKRIDPLADAIDEIKRDGADRVVARVENLVTRRPSPFLELQPVVTLAQPVVRWALEG